MLLCGLGSLLLVSCQEQEIRFYNIMALVLIILVFGLFIYFHHLSSVRLKKAYRELEIANNRAQELSRRIGGDIKVDTAYIGGSRFVMTLPINTYN